MALTQAQKTSLKTDIIAATDPACVALENDPANPDKAAAVAALYNLAAAGPNNIGWKKLVNISEVGDAFNGTELAGLTGTNNDRLRTLAMYSPNGVNPSLANRRQFFDDVFSGAGGTNTRAALLALWKRTLTRAQKLFSTGTGSDASPATTDANVGDTFALTYLDVLAAMAEG